MAEKDYSNYPDKPTAAHQEKDRQTMVALYKHMDSSGNLPGFKKANPKGHAALKKVYDNHVSSTTMPAAKKPAAPKTASSKPAAKPAPKKAAPVAKKAAPKKAK
jgi:hypothetical protein